MDSVLKSLLLLLLAFFVSHKNGSACCVTKSRKNGLAQGSLGRRLTPFTSLQCRRILVGRELLVYMFVLL